MIDAVLDNIFADVDVDARGCRTNSLPFLVLAFISFDVFVGECYASDGADILGVLVSAVTKDMLLASW